MSAIHSDPLDVLREQIAALLQGGVPTEWRQRAYTSDAVNVIVADLHRLQPDDIEGKLRLAGFMSQAYAAADEDISQACETCMYFERHRQFCVLPELMLPVRPEWSCRLWRI
jgi:hypothetical protein